MKPSAETKTFPARPVAKGHSSNGDARRKTFRFRTIETRILIENFLDHLVSERGYSKVTRCGYWCDLSQFLHFLHDTSPAERIADLSPAHLRAYQTAICQQRDRRRGTPLSLKSISNKLSTVRMFFRWLVRSGHLLADPSAVFVLPKYRKNPPSYIPTPKEIARIIDACPRSPFGIRDRAVIELLYGSGIRSGELRTLTIDGVDFENGTVRVHGKGGRDRVVPMGTAAANALKEYLARARPALFRAPTNILFLNYQGGPFKFNRVADILHDACKAAGITRRIHPHLLRHACATHMLQGGANLRHVQVQLGHASIHTTQIYTHLNITDLKRVHRKTHPRELDRVPSLDA
jgi:site-specific recombinase XerD